MKLRINNFAKIKSADFSIDGITVIVGNNNTGKSTVGKILASIFNSLVDIQKRVENAKIRRMQEEAWSTVTTEIPFNTKHGLRSLYPRFLDSESKKLQNFLFSDDEKIQKKISDDYANYIYNRLYNENDKVDINDIKDFVFKTLKKTSTISDSMFEEQIVSVYFQKVFNGQINDIHNKDSNATVKIIVKDCSINIEFKNERVKKIIRNFNITNTATYIENPYIIDKFNQSRLFGRFNSMPILENDLLKKLFPNDDENFEKKAMNLLFVEDSLKDINDVLNSIVPGDFLQKDKFIYKKEGVDIDVNSLSTGLKSFGIIKQLLLNGGIKNKDILILDEPEIHLHPDWQLKYAQIIVLLQKTFNLNIIITTHSSHFFEAIDVYSKIYGIRNRCNYYLSDEKEGYAEFTDVTEDSRPIFTSLVEPNLRLDEIKVQNNIED